MNKLLIFLIPIIMFFHCNTDQTVQIEKEFYKLQQKYTWLDFSTYRIILQNSIRYTIEPAYVCAVIQYESGDYCANNLPDMIKVISWAGARGIMQVMPFHSDTPDELLTAKGCIKKGCWYLSKCLKKGKGNIREAARMYNAGLFNIRSNYKNWAYVNRIEKSVNEFMQGA